MTKLINEKEIIDRSELLKDYNPEENESILCFLKQKLKVEYPDKLFKKIDMYSDKPNEQSDILMKFHSYDNEEDSECSPSLSVHVLVPHNVILESAKKYQ